MAMTARTWSLPLALITAAALTACATEPLEYRPRPDMQEVARRLDCPADKTPTCVERVNKPYSCFCMDEDLLKRVLDPEAL